MAALSAWLPSLVDGCVRLSSFVTAGDAAAAFRSCGVFCGAVLRCWQLDLALGSLSFVLLSSVLVVRFPSGPVAA